MTFELDAAAAARRDAAEAVARDTVAPAAAAADRSAELPAAVRAAARRALPEVPAEAPVDWVVAIEALAAASPTVALIGAGEALGAPTVTAAAQWSGLRGADADGLAAALADDWSWHLAVTATLVGAARAAVDAGVAALKAATAHGASGLAGQPLVADAATAVDASRLLLWNAAAERPDASGAAVARGLARLHALDALRGALASAERACDPEAFRPGAELERLRRDAATVAQVLGDAGRAAEAVAAGTFPA